MDARNPAIFPDLELEAHLGLTIAPDVEFVPRVGDVFGRLTLSIGVSGQHLGGGGAYADATTGPQNRVVERNAVHYAVISQQHHLAGGEANKPYSLQSGLAT